MEFTSEARQAVEDQLKAIMGRMTLSGEDRAEVEKELRSSIYTRAEARASARGSMTVSAEDVKEASAGERAPGEIAACYARSYAPGLPRAGFWPRLAAYIIDSFVIGAAIFTAILPVIFLGWLTDLTKHNPFITAMLVFTAVAFILAVLGVTICYFTVLEGRFGKTVGKYVMGLSVLKTSGERIGYKDALLRNIPKYIRNLLIIDVLIMLLFFNKEKQRGFDRVADTMVVHLR